MIAGLKACTYVRIVNIASIAGKEGNPYASFYAAPRAGVGSITIPFGKEPDGYDIAVNYLMPTAARPAIIGQMIQEHIDYMLPKIPRNQFVGFPEKGIYSSAVLAKALG